ncbi:MAG: malto-oligosyltrehalose synthase [Casimicrobiaceae bacterium]
MTPSASAEPGPPIPRATYRVQLHRGFTFEDARAIVPYLAALGISHLYASPFLKARAGSTHGYDVVDHDSLNPEIGNAEDLDALVAALHAHSMGLMLDLVPNHMGVLKADNGWWLDVLEHGQRSRYADYFDIDWAPESADLAGKVLVPILGDQYGSALDRGELTLRFDAAAGSISLWYFDHRLPVRPHEYATLIARAAGQEHALASSLADAAAAVIARFAAADAVDGTAGTDATEQGQAAKAALAALCARRPALADAIEAAVAACNGRVGSAASFDALHQLIQRQAYRLAFWRVAADDINYRRFFDINDLAALRAERSAVFDATHRIALALVATGKADALRIDHPDGLLDPAAYFDRLQAAAAVAIGNRGGVDHRGRAIYLVIEKILATHERLPAQWPVHGTTGYTFMNLVNRLFVDPSNRTRFDRLYASFSGEHATFSRISRESKLGVVGNAMRSELTRLATALTRIAKADRHTCDFTRDGIHRALMHIVASFPIYRTYATDAGLGATDERYIEWAVAVARRRSTAADTSVFDFVAAALRGLSSRGEALVADSPLGREARAFRARFQQFTAPVMAKGTEDTAFYVYNRLASLNEVGGDPAIFGAGVNAFHGVSMLRSRDWPHAMLATSTHDSKRGEDVRTRIDVLSEMPAAWRLSLRRWRQLNRRHRRDIGGHPAPSANDEYLLYQTLLGTWPGEALAAGTLPDGTLADHRERVAAFMLKAAREAKVCTSWLNPDAAYEAALAHFVDRVLASPQTNRFIESMLPLAREVARVGCVNSLAQTLVKLTSPGVPDTYQGTELWDLNMVDPDNRRPVDFAHRVRMLQEFAARGIQAPPADALLAAWPGGSVKLWLTWRLLQLRKQRAQWFDRAGYMPIATRGAHSDRVCAYARRAGCELLLCVVPRLWSSLPGARSAWPLGAAFWGDTAVVLPIDARRWRNVLTGEAVDGESAMRACLLPVGSILATFPVASLELR